MLALPGYCQFLQLLEAVFLVDLGLERRHVHGRRALGILKAGHPDLVASSPGAEALCLFGKVLLLERLGRTQHLESYSF